MAALAPSTPDRLDRGWTRKIPGHFKFTPRGAAGRWSSCVPASRSRPEQWEAIIDRRATSSRPPSDLDHRLLFVQHEPNGRELEPVGYRRDDQASTWMQPHWVGDLTLSARLSVNAPGARFGSS